MALTAYIIGSITVLTAQGDMQMLQYRKKVADVEGYLGKQASFRR